VINRSDIVLVTQKKAKSCPVSVWIPVHESKPKHIPAGSNTCFHRGHK